MKNKKEKELEEKFKKTDRGKRIFIMNMVSNFLFAISFFLLYIVISNIGNTFTPQLACIMLVSYIAILSAGLLCTSYYYSLKQYIKENSKKEKK